MRTLCIALLTALPLLSLAQEKEDDEKWNGLRAGYHSSNVDGEWGDADARTGFYAGYYRNLIKVPLYRLSTGLEYHTAGATGSVSEVRLGYVSLAINNRLKLGPMYLDLGIDPALKVGEKNLVNGTEVDVPDDAKAERFDLLAHAGAGFKFLFLGVEVRYRRGLLEVYEGTYNTGLELGLTTFF
ncbi:MAG: hypothetical protein JNL52_12175 [Flavobacteriales bacterium]|nr:hypothetical protein [Flavobacteriales bacterium]